jgi:hypothetical protein
MATQAKCGECGSAIKGGAKFCPSCGTRVPVANVGSGVTLASAIDHLRELGEELDNGVVKLLVPLGEERSQLVFVLPVEDDDPELEDLCLWSNFALTTEVALKTVIGLDAQGFGFVQIGDFYSVQTSIRPWQLRDLEALTWIVFKVAIAADNIEGELLGSDEY